MSDTLSPRSPRRKREDQGASTEPRKRSRWEEDDGDNDKEKANNNRGDKKDSKSRRDDRRQKDGDRDKDRDRDRDRDRRRERDKSRDKERHKHDRNRDRDRRRRDGSEDKEEEKENGGREQRRRHDRERDRRRHDERDDNIDELDTKMIDEPPIFMNKEREKMIEKQNERDRMRERRERFKGAGREDRQQQQQQQQQQHHKSNSRSRSPRRGSPDRLENSLDNGEPPAEKEKPNLNRTHHLVAETNTVNGTVLKHVEPSDARLPPPRDRWKMYVFKGDAHMEDIALDSRSCWLFGRDRSVADLPVDHPSCSGQHAALQFRFVSSTNEWGEKSGAVKPYIIDLKSANSTFVNGDKIPSERYYELRNKDLVKFGLSTREYILMLEK